MSIQNQVFDRTAAVLSTGADAWARKIYLFGEIEEAMAHRFIVSFEVMDQSPGDIVVVLSSGGGSEPAGYAIYDCIKMSKNHVTIVGMGAVQSIAALIMQAGDLRLLSPEARFMIHNGHLEMDGASIDSDKLLSISKEVSTNNLRYSKLLADRSRQQLIWVQKACEREAYFSSEECLEYGFIDGILVPGHTKSVLQSHKINKMDK